LRYAARVLMLPGFRSLLAIIVAVSLSLPSWAHRAPGSLTTLKWNEASGRTEIVHRLHSHDAELGVAAILGASHFSIIDVQARAKAALYVESRFQIMMDNADLKPTLVGAELAGQYLFVYQELPQRLGGSIKVRDDILRDAFPAQINQVNIVDGDIVHTLTFNADNEWLSYQYRQTFNKG